MGTFPQIDDIVLDEIKAVQEQYHRGAEVHEIQMRLAHPHYFGKNTNAQYSPRDVGWAIMNLIDYRSIELDRRGLLKHKGKTG